MNKTGLYWIGKATTAVVVDGVVTSAPVVVDELHSEAEVERFYATYASPCTKVEIEAHEIGKPLVSRKQEG